MRRPPSSCLGWPPWPSACRPSFDESRESSRIKGVEPNHFWYSTGFAAAILSSMVLASWWLWDSPVARILIALAGAAAFLAGTTSFCLGRIVYVVIFQIRNDQACN